MDYIQISPYSNIRLKSKRAISLASFICLIICMIICIHNFLLIFGQTKFSVINKTIAILFMIALSFSIIHTIGFIDKVLKSLLTYEMLVDHQNRRVLGIPKVAIFIPIYNEDPCVVESSILACKLINYDNFEIFLLDDSIEGNISNNFIHLTKKLEIKYIHRSHRRGYKAGAINDAINNLAEDVRYILIIDADHKVKPYILKELVPILENDMSISFIQTPQYFVNEIKNKIAVCYSIQQRIFNKHVCRGLNINNAVFLTGTNALIRLNDLRIIGGMNETYITEDIATSFDFGLHGYKGVFFDRIYAEGIPPLCISAYFAQQKRWAYGTTQNFSRIIKAFLSNPFAFRVDQWWEFMLNGSWYFLGFTFIIFVFYSFSVIFLDIRPMTFELGMLCSLQFILMTIIPLITIIREGNYRLLDFLFALSLYYSSYFIHIEALINVFIRNNMEFSVTPKSFRYCLKTNNTTIIYHHLVILASLIFLIIIGIWKMTLGSTGLDMLLAICWAGYNIVLISVFLYIYLSDHQNLEREAL
ncbi:MAG: glycosyltransferase family 2 protein [Methanotrichaceae archaeon]